MTDLPYVIYSQTIEFDRRQAKGFPKFDMPEVIRERALELVHQAEEAERQSSLKPGSPSSWT